MTLEICLNLVIYRTKVYFVILLGIPYIPSIKVYNGSPLQFHSKFYFHMPPNCLFSAHIRFCSFFFWWLKQTFGKFLRKKYLKWYKWNFILEFSFILFKEIKLSPWSFSRRFFSLLYNINSLIDVLNQIVELLSHH